MTATQVSATLAEYGNVTNVSSLFSMTQIDVDLKEHIEVHGQNAGESIDQLIRNELHAGATSQQVATATTASNFSNIHLTDVFTGLEVRKAVRTLKIAKAQRFESGLFRGIIGPANSYDLFGNSEWLDAHRYTTSDAIERGVVGKLHGVEFVETNNQYVTLSGGFSTALNSVANVYETYIFGKNAYGVVNLGSITAPTVIVKNPGPNDTSNPLNMYSTVGLTESVLLKPSLIDLEAQQWVTGGKIVSIYFQPERLSEKALERVMR